MAAEPAAVVFMLVLTWGGNRFLWLAVKSDKLMAHTRPIPDEVFVPFLERLRALSRLDARSRDIVQRRWMSEDKATLHELAGKYGVSAERIRQIESSALGKLRGMMAA